MLSIMLRRLIAAGAGGLSATAGVLGHLQAKQESETAV